MNVLAQTPVLGNQFGGGDVITQILSVLFYVFFIVFLFYGQRIQMYVMIREVEGSLFKLKIMRDEGRKMAIETREERLKYEVKLMAPASDDVQVNNLENTLEAAMALNFIYKIVRHFYLQ